MGNTAGTSTGFSRSFFIFTNEDGGYEAGQKPSGHVRLEVRDGKGKLHAAVQNLKPGNGRFGYGLYLLRTVGNYVTAAYAGSLESKMNKAELEWGFDPRNVDGTGIAIGEIDTVVVLVEHEGFPRDTVICPLAAYKSTKTGWRSHMGPAMLKKGKQVQTVQGQPIQELLKQGQPIQELPKQGQPTQELPKQGQPIQELPKQEQPIQELPKQEQPIKEQMEWQVPKTGMEMPAFGVWPSQYQMPMQQNIPMQQPMQIPQYQMPLQQNIPMQQPMQIPQYQMPLQQNIPMQQPMQIQQYQMPLQQEIPLQPQPQEHEETGQNLQEVLQNENQTQEQFVQENAEQSLKQPQAGQQPTNQIDTGCVYLNGNICGAFVNNGAGANPCAACQMHNGSLQRTEPPAGDVLQLKEELDRYFERCDPFHSNRSDYIWWRVGNPVNLNNLLYQCNIRSPLLFNPSVMMAHYKYRHLIVGIFTQKGNEKQYVVCGVPGMSLVDKKPFGDMSRWVQAEGNRPRYGAFGYWLVYINPNGGQILNMNQE